MYTYTLYTYIYSTYIYSIYTHMLHIHIYSIYTCTLYIHIYCMYTYTLYIHVCTIYTHIHFIHTHTYIILWGFVVGWLVGDSLMLLPRLAWSYSPLVSAPKGWKYWHVPACLARGFTLMGTSEGTKRNGHPWAKQNTGAALAAVL